MAEPGHLHGDQAQGSVGEAFAKQAGKPQFGPHKKPGEAGMGLPKLHLKTLLVRSFYHVGPWDPTEVIKHGSKSLHLLDYLTSPSMI